jgi:hypothetical protein
MTGIFADSGADLAVDAPWSTSCAFPDPLPDDAKIVYIQTRTDVQLCSRTLRTAVHVSLNNDTLTPISSDSVGGGSGCECDAGGFSVFDELTTPPVSYRHGDQNTLKITGPGGIPSTLRIFHVEVFIVYVRKPQPQYYTGVEVTTDPESIYRVDHKTDLGGTATVNVALGTAFGVVMVKQDSQNPLGPPAAVPLATTVVSQNVSPALETVYNLFDQQTLVPISAGAPAGETARFVAVHLGTTTLRLLPLSVSGAAPVILAVNVVRPASLGGSHNEWDARLTDAAHERGIPPQILKGQIRQESPDFSDTEWRYEPCSSDFASISGGAHLIGTTPYNLYAMDAALSDPAFASTVDLRNDLWLPDPDVDHTRPITHADRGVTARQIWEANPEQHWDTIICGARVVYLRTHLADEFLTALEFIAQTPTASSYGVLQAMYETALGYGWSVSDPQNPGGVSRSPRFLRDTPESLALVRGGSLFVGGSEDVQRYWDKAPAATAFLSQDEFFDSFIVPLRFYTGGGIANYGTNIINGYMYDYLPEQPAAIFP